MVEYYEKSLSIERDPQLLSYWQVTTILRKIMPRLLAMPILR